MIFDNENWRWKSDLGTFYDPCEHLWNSNQKSISLIDFFAKSLCWLTSSKLHYWGHITIYHHKSNSYSKSLQVNQSEWPGIDY